ncbi:phosphodiester glycosidase family protein [Candidatus Daviesbacteria bacterium]|nr:phosphodiester glycosidase family protein [Candidatus Daviesbacteria bacterium]
MVTDTANDSDCPKDCPTIPLADFASRNGAFAAINGTYFCPAAYPECADKKDSFDFPVLNSKNKKWLNEGNFSWNNRSLIYQEGATMYYRQDANSYRGGPGGGIVNYPGILNNGQITVEQGQLSEKQGTKGTKGGIGFAGTKVYLVIAYNVDMADFAQLFKAIGAQNALNLDGGGSAALWYEGGYKVGPGRNLPNAVLFVR